MKRRGRRRLGGAIGAGLVCCGLIACGSSSPSGTTGVSSGAARDTGGSEATTALASSFAGRAYGEPPKTSPRPQPGKRVWVIDVGLASEGGAAWAKAAQRAGDAMGWDVTVFDGKFTPSEYLNGIRAAIGAKADGILLVSIDCSTVKAGLQEARKAGIAISAVESFDCSEIDPEAPSLFDASVIYRVGGKPARLAEQDREMGRLQADWVARATDGKGKIVLFKGTDNRASILIHDGFVQRIREVCAGCEIAATVPFTSADIQGSGFRQKLEQALLKNPTANAVVAPYDDPLVAGAAAAIVTSGRNDDLAVVAGTGFADAVGLIKENKGLDAGYGLAEGWESYAGMDNLNRVFHGQKAVPSGIALGLVDRDHLPAAGAYEPPVDYATAYERAWAGR